MTQEKADKMITAVNSEARGTARLLECFHTCTF